MSWINFAAIKKLPAVFVVEHNQIAENTPIQKVLSIENIADRAGDDPSLLNVSPAESGPFT